MTRLIVLLGFILSFAAGMLAFSRIEHPTSEPMAPGAAATTQPDETDGGDHHGMHHGPPMMRGGFLPRELNLTDDQQQKIRQIWSSVANQGPREIDEKRRALNIKRDQAVAAMMPADRKAEYEKIQSDFFAQMNAMDAGFRKQFDEAVKQTEALLTDEQRSKYEEIRNRMRPPGDREHDHADGGPDGPDDHGPPPFGGRGGFGGGPGGSPRGPRDGGGF